MFSEDFFSMLCFLNVNIFNAYLIFKETKVMYSYSVVHVVIDKNKTISVVLDVPLI